MIGRLICWLRNHHHFGPITQLYICDRWHTGRVCRTCKRVHSWPLEASP
jgi:hypothetical protein